MYTIKAKRWVAASDKDKMGDNGVAHATGNSCSKVELWSHPWENREIEKHFMQWRGELVPYIYKHAVEAEESGVSLIRPLYYEHGDVARVAPQTQTSSTKNNANADVDADGEGDVDVVQ